MLALVTGASTGIGRDIARELASRGYSLVLVARSQDKLEHLQSTLNVPCKVVSMDLSDPANCKKLYQQMQGKRLDVLVNNAGFGSFGSFTETDLDNDLNMIRLNVCAVHTLTKLFMKDFLKANHGMILNVASSAAFMIGGPLMASYYASKAYVLHLSEAVYEEIRRQKSRASISVLCPGPVSTCFNERASVKFALPSMESRKVAKFAVEKMLQKKLVIVPGTFMKLSHTFLRVIPDKLALKVGYHLQRRKQF